MDLSYIVWRHPKLMHLIGFAAVSVLILVAWHANKFVTPLSVVQCPKFEVKVVWAFNPNDFLDLRMRLVMDDRTYPHPVVVSGESTFVYEELGKIYSCQVEGDKLVVTFAALVDSKWGKYQVPVSGGTPWLVE